MTMTLVFPLVRALVAVVGLSYAINGADGFVQPLHNVQSVLSSRVGPGSPSTITAVDHRRHRHQKSNNQLPIRRQQQSLFAIDASTSGEFPASSSSSPPKRKKGELEIIEAVVVESTSSTTTAESSSNGETTDKEIPPAAASDSVIKTATSSKKKKTIQELRAEGGPFTVNTPIGALNPFALYYGLTSVFLGIPWFLGCQLCRFMSWITGGRFDPKKRIPLFLSQVWGTALMKLTRCTPTYRNLDVLHKFYEENRAAMFVANHCSWMDIPFLGSTVGWRNYKIVAKKELGAVPILGTAILAGGHIMVDRSDRRSQLNTLKQGINYLKSNVNLCTFPEGTRSRTGRMMKFKNGAFKMAYKAGAPIVPLSIVNSHKVMPTGWMMAMRPAHGIAEVIVHEPIESKGKTEEELVEAVRKSMMEGLPDDQKPL